MRSQRVGHDWATELNWTELKSEQQLKTHLDVWLTEGDAVCVRLHWSFPLACVTFPYKFLLTFVILPLLCRGRGRFPSVLLLQSKIPGVDGWEDKEFAFNAGVLGLIPGLGRSPGEGNGNPLQYSGLENSTDRGAWQATVHGVAKSGMIEQHSLHFSTSPQYAVAILNCSVLSSPSAQSPTKLEWEALGGPSGSVRVSVILHIRYKALAHRPL